MGDTLYIQGNIVIDTAKSKASLTNATIQKSQLKFPILERSDYKIYVPIFVTLIIFFLGQFLGYYFKKQERKTKLQNSKTSLETWILQLEETAQQLMKNCAEFNDELTNNDHIQPVILQYSPTLINKISELSVDDFLNYSTLNLVGSEIGNAEKAFDIIHQIEFMKNVELDIRKHYDEFSIKVDKLLDKWNLANNDLLKAKLEMFNEVGNDPLHISFGFSHLINTFLNSWMAAKHDFKSITVWEEKFIKPFWDIIYEEIYVSPKDKYPSIFSDKLQALQEVILTWKVVREGYSILIKGYGEDFLESYLVLKQDIVQLKKQNLVTVWRIK